MTLLILSDHDINQILSKERSQISLQIIEKMAHAFSQYTLHQQISIQVQSPQRIGISTNNHKVLFMPSRLNDTTSVKIVSVPTKEGIPGLPAANIVLDESTGKIDAILNATHLTAIRTAAGSGLATQYCAHPNAKRLVVFGAGAQGRSHVDMMIAARPSISHVAIWNRTKNRRDVLIHDLKRDYPDLEVVPLLENDDLIKQADIICTCTNATVPVLKGSLLKKGVHINCIGSYRLDMHEVDEDTIKRSDKILVDSISACKEESGELMKSSTPKEWMEIGQVVLNGVPLHDSQKISLFKSVGISIQDSAISAFIIERAKIENIGQRVSF
ncbi:hypothetical protein BDB01DRAFT_775584 [Pilobolus umbonatus]|nr:hypothetical protein BDB01DRAFT_775584 [Pilobolus umbonatus]